jgi:hypothetical protein
MAWIFISLMTADVEYLSYVPVYVLGEMFVPVPCPFSNLVVCLFVFEPKQTFTYPGF